MHFFHKVFPSQGLHGVTVSPTPQLPKFHTEIDQVGGVIIKMRKQVLNCWFMFEEYFEFHVKRRWT